MTRAAFLAALLCAGAAVAGEPIVPIDVTVDISREGPRPITASDAGRLIVLGPHAYPLASAGAGATFCFRVWADIAATVKTDQESWTVRPDKALCLASDGVRYLPLSVRGVAEGRR